MSLPSRKPLDVCGNPQASGQTLELLFRAPDLPEGLPWTRPEDVDKEDQGRLAGSSREKPNSRGGQDFIAPIRADWLDGQWKDFQSRRYRGTPERGHSGVSPSTSLLRRFGARPLPGFRRVSNGPQNGEALSPPLDNRLAAIEGRPGHSTGATAEALAFWKPSWPKANPVPAFLRGRRCGNAAPSASAIFSVLYDQVTEEALLLRSNNVAVWTGPLTKSSNSNAV